MTSPSGHGKPGFVLDQMVVRVVVFVGLEAPDGHETMIGQLDDQRLCPTRHSSSPPRVRLEPTQGDQA